MRISEYKSLMRNRRQEMRQLWCREGGDGGYMEHMKSPEQTGTSNSQLSPTMRLGGNFEPGMLGMGGGNKGFYYPNESLSPSAVSPGGNSSTNYDSRDDD